MKPAVAAAGAGLISTLMPGAVGFQTLLSKGGRDYPEDKQRDQEDTS